MVILSVMSVAACAQDPSGGEDEGSASASSSSSSSSSSATLTTTASSSNSTTAPTEGPDECEGGGLDECEYGDIGDFTCNIILQDCPGPRKCVPYWTADEGALDYRCVEVTGDHGPGEACSLDSLETANDNCDATGFCWSYWTGQLEGRCHPYCTGGFQYADCIDGWDCNFPEDGPPMCVQSCVPLAGDCGPGTQCLWADPDFSCMPEGAGLGPGEACSVINDCAAELLCLDALSLAGCEGESCCAAYCGLGAGDGPCQAIDPSYVCEPFFVLAPPGLEDLGLCMLPM